MMMMMMMIMGTSSDDDDDDFISLHTTYRLDQLQTVHRRVHVRTQRHALSQPHLHPSHEQGTTTAIIHLSIYLSIYLSGHLTYLPIYLSILPSSSSFIDPSIYPFIQSCIHLSTHLSHRSIYHIYPSITSIHLFIQVPGQLIPMAAWVEDTLLKFYVHVGEPVYHKGRSDHDDDHHHDYDCGDVVQSSSSSSLYNHQHHHPCAIISIIITTTIIIIITIIIILVQSSSSLQAYCMIPRARVYSTGRIPRRSRYTEVKLAHIDDTIYGW